MDGQSSALDVTRNKQTSKRWHEAWGTPDLEHAYRDCLHEDFQADFFGPGKVDKRTYMTRDTQFLTAFSDVEIRVEEMVGEGETVMCRMRWTGRHTGDAPGMKASGKAFEVAGFCVDHYRDGKVVSHTPLFDQASLMKQLGLGA